MSARPLVTIHLPMDTRRLVRILKAVTREFPDAIVDQTSGAWVIRVDAPVTVQEARTAPDSPGMATDATGTGSGGPGTR